MKYIAISRVCKQPSFTPDLLSCRLSGLSQGMSSWLTENPKGRLFPSVSISIISKLLLMHFLNNYLQPMSRQNSQAEVIMEKARQFHSPQICKCMRLLQKQRYLSPPCSHGEAVICLIATRKIQIRHLEELHGEDFGALEQTTMIVTPCPSQTVFKNRSDIFQDQCRKNRSCPGVEAGLHDLSRSLPVMFSMMLCTS